ncbi:hybrid sensor histidine kinase/response regulator [Isoalcanivorax beigongshangi]|uniref:histidine kinase n=1 Tax=Isoalcanivorax beigongshangi TaxID=3238810 RepID=A0ABV4AGZ9_9GAMM
MYSQPFHNILQASKWLHGVAFAVVPLLLALALVLFLGGARLLEQTEDKIGLDFFALTTYLNSQNNYLASLQQRSSEPSWAPPAQRGDSPMREPASDDAPYALLCVEPGACTGSAAGLAAWGEAVSALYLSHWSRSYYPGVTTLLLDGRTPQVVLVPGFDWRNRDALYTPSVLDAVVTELQQQLHTAPGDAVRWLPLAALPDAVAGIVPLAGQRGDAAPLYAVSTFSLARTSLFQNVSETPLYDQLWLQTAEGTTVIGHGARPSTRGALTLGWDGIVLALEDHDGGWRGVYRISYGTFLHANPRLPLLALLLLVVVSGAAALYLRWHRRRVLEPARLAHQELVESEAFNRTLLDTAPVGLCVVTRGEGRLVFCNALAQQWLGQQPLSPGELLAPGVLPAAILGANGPGKSEPLQLGERYVQVVYAPTRYQQQPVVLCTFVDISSRVLYEQELERARQEADSANVAKTRFLAAVSHEVRTPLYGIMGTLELLAMAPLGEGERHHLRRLEHASAQLMQQISDVLDFTKIEAGQMALHEEAFNARQLLQGCADQYAAAAARKGLLLFACIDPAVPEWLLGDAGRIRQVLNNLLSNALKFTGSGQIIARLYCEPTADGRWALRFQVADSGSGISSADQAQLFVPFFQADQGDTPHSGTGLGLSICHSLAQLMGGEIQVTSELGLGSSFTLALTLAAGDCSPAPVPALAGLSLVLRSPHAELTRNVCQWLRQWGADATALAATDTETPCAAEFFVEVLGSGNAPPAGAGRVVQAGPLWHDVGDGVDVLPGYGAEELAEGLLRLQRAETTSVVLTPAAELGLRVLVAEDNPINQATLRDQLQQLGCRVVVVDDGREALRQWAPERFDVVLTDVNMPHLNGYGLTQALRERGAELPIIGVTANAMRDEHRRCAAAGMDAWLVKPIDLHTLRRCLQRVVPEAPAATERPDIAPAAAPLPHDGGADAEVRAAALAELVRIADKNRTLFRDCMLADAGVLADAAAQQDSDTAQQRLHRIHGGLLAVGQSRLAAEVEQVRQSFEDHGTPDWTALQALVALINDVVHTGLPQ